MLQILILLALLCGYVTVCRTLTFITNLCQPSRNLHWEEPGIAPAVDVNAVHKGWMEGALSLARLDQDRPTPLKPLPLQPYKKPRTIALPISSTISSLMPVAKKFQLDHARGGVSPTPLSRASDGERKEKTIEMQNFKGKYCILACMLFV